MSVVRVMPGGASVGGAAGAAARVGLIVIAICSHGAVPVLIAACGTLAGTNHTVPASRRPRDTKHHERYRDDDEGARHARESIIRSAIAKSRNPTAPRQ